VHSEATRPLPALLRRAVHGRGAASGIEGAAIGRLSATGVLRWWRAGARLTAQTTQLDGRVTTSMAQLEARLLKRLDSHFRWLAGVILAQFGLTMIAVLGLYFR